MSTEVQVERDGDWEDIDYNDWEISNGVSDVQIAPEATIETHSREDVEANQPIRIQIDGETRFEGRTTSEGRQALGGNRQIECEHNAFDLFDENISLEVNPSVGVPDVGQVLSDALDETDAGGDYSLEYDGSSINLEDAYIVEDRSLKRVFRDMMDRTHRVWWIDVDNVIHVEELGARGEWDSVEFPGDDGAVRQYDSGDISTVRNDVTVNGTRDTRVVGEASDPSSMTDYGRHSETFNVEYIASEAEAEAMAGELIIPEPLADGEVILSPQFGDEPDQNLSNYELEVSDEAKDIDSESLVIEQQIIEQGSVTLQLGEGSGVSVENVNRSSKSRDDNSEPGSVMDTDRIDDEAIVEQKVGDDSIATPKLQDLAVEVGKIGDGAVEGEKIAVDAVATSHLQADAVEAGIIAADAVGTRELIAQSITADEIDSLTLDTGMLTITNDPDNPDQEIVFSTAANSIGIIPEGDVFIGTAASPFDQVVSNEFIDGETGEPINDGGTELEGLSDLSTIPDFCRCGGGVSINTLSKWLFDVCREQQQEIEQLEATMDDFEERIASLEVE